MSGFDGNGNFSFTYNWVNDAANGIPITASRMDTQFNDAAQGFDNCVTRDGQSPPTADIPWGGYNLVNVGALGILTSNPLAPLHVGDGTTNNSVDASILVSRDVVDSPSGNCHAYSDSSQIDRAGTIGYASYDARININGSQDYDHYVAFQASPTFATTGTITNYYGVVTRSDVSSGCTITNHYGVYAQAPNSAGTVTHKYAFVSEAGAGNVGIGLIAPTDRFEVYDDLPLGAAKSTVLNDNAGTAAQAAFVAKNGTHSAFLGMLGTGFTTVGLQRQDGMYVSTDGAGGLTLYTGSNTPLYFGSNSTAIGNWTTSLFTVSTALLASGNVGIGSNDPFSRGYDKILAVSSAAGGSALEINSNTGSSAYIDLGVAGTRLLGISSDTSGSRIGTNTNLPFSLLQSGTTCLALDGTNIVISSGQALKLGNAYVATPQVGTGYVTLKDSTGTTYKVLVAA